MAVIAPAIIALAPILWVKPTISGLINMELDM
jgi:hypothetical protein